MEDLAVNGVELVEFGMTVAPQDAPDEVEEVSIGFEAGVPISVNGQSLGPFEIVERLNEIGEETESGESTWSRTDLWG